MAPGPGGGAIVVTGAANGIGAAVAERLRARCGCLRRRQGWARGRHAHAFLLLAENTYVSGARIVVDGALTVGF